MGWVENYQEQLEPEIVQYNKQGVKSSSYRGLILKMLRIITNIFPIMMTDTKPQILKGKKISI